MLQQFTWEHFLIAAAAITAVWYIAVILLFFRMEIGRLFAGKPKDQRTEPEPPEPPDEEEDNPIGSVSMPEGMENIDPDDLTFAPKRDAESKTQMLGTVSDFLQEIKLLTEVLKREEGDKVAFHQMFTILKARYPAIRESGRLETLTSYLQDHLPFTLTEEEKQHLWD
ncbi:hypothetical protein [Parapedobacter koreensis]|nr:hypothetical protein [Parapedobacter koreensis]